MGHQTTFGMLVRIIYPHAHPHSLSFSALFCVQGGRFSGCISWTRLPPDFQLAQPVGGTSKQHMGRRRQEGRLPPGLVLISREGRVARACSFLLSFAPSCVPAVAVSLQCLNSSVHAFPEGVALPGLP